MEHYMRWEVHGDIGGIYQNNIYYLLLKKNKWHTHESDSTNPKLVPAEDHPSSRACFLLLFLCELLIIENEIDTFGIWNLGDHDSRALELWNDFKPQELQLVILDLCSKFHWKTFTLWMTATKIGRSKIA